MTNDSHRARWAAGVLAAVMALMVACTKFKDDLLTPQNFGAIDPAAVQSAAAATALRVGAIGRLKNMVNASGGETLWEESGNLADEFRNSDFQISRADVDRRTMTTNNPQIPYDITRSRGFIRDALAAMKQFLPNNTADIAELYMALGFTEMSLAENFCNGIPLGATIAGQQSLGPPLTNAQVYDTASAHLDTALAINTGTDASSIVIKNAALITKARILVDKGQFAAAAALVPAAIVSSTYQYIFVTSVPTGDLGIWSLNNSVARITVSDSFDILNGAVNTVKNALPFASANDPRVPVKAGSALNPKITAEDGTTPMFIQQIWPGRSDPIPMVSGIDARLIEAESKLNAADYAGMMTILNALRAAPPKIGNFQPGPMSPIAGTPATKDDAVTLFFREKAFWVFGRGQRLSDLRRLMRQYGRTEDQTFPTGVYNGWGGGVYGHDVNFPVPDAELANPLFKGCLDRLP
ncbi:MAG TPA: hypothetical protein VHE78_00230 [Gemmatimonadaceae bacterium]|nr:hypothetical protein [Gemmatimonadaceae bacterium]